MPRFITHPLPIACLFFSREEQFWWFCKWLLDRTHSCRLANFQSGPRFPIANFYGFSQDELNDHFDNFMRQEQQIVAAIRGITA